MAQVMLSMGWAMIQNIEREKQNCKISRTSLNRAVMAFKLEARQKGFHLSLVLFNISICFLLDQLLHCEERKDSITD